VDQRSLSDKEVGVVEQGLPCSQSEGHGPVGGGMVAARWQRGEFARLDRHVVRQRAVTGPVGQPERSLPNGQAGGVVTQFGDDTHTSCLGTLGVRSRPARSVRVPADSSSPGVNPPACTRAMTSFSAACGYGTSVSDNPARPGRGRGRRWLA
jgi:hypothetical protein